MVNAKVLELEKLVSLAQLKICSTANVTLAIQNGAMSSPAAEFYGYPRVKQERHPHNILVDKQAFLVGMLMRFPIDRAIVTGHWARMVPGLYKKDARSSWRAGLFGKRIAFPIPP